MPVLANARYERFAQIVANGKLTPTTAYREALGVDAKDADVNSCRWMKKPPIAKRIAQLKAKAAGKCNLSREAYIQSLVEMYEAKPSDASMDKPMCDVVVVRGQKQALFPPKLQVGQQLARLCGRPDQGRARRWRLSARLFRLDPQEQTGRAAQRRRDGCLKGRYVPKEKVKRASPRPRV